MSSTDPPTAVGDAPTLAARRLDGLAERVARSRPAADADDRADDPAGDPDALDVFAPATDERIGSVPACDASDVDAAVERAREAQSAWAEVPAAERARIVDRFGDLVANRREELLDVLQLETGKSRRTAVEELFDVPSGCAYVASEAPDALAEERRRGVAPGITTATVTREPVGVVGVISPWNYPLTLSMADAIPALAAGNAVVLKPDEKTPYGALLLSELLELAGLPDDLFQVVTGEGETVGPPLIDAVDYVAFTGSTAVGRTIAERAGRNLIGCSLELGGNNPLVVLGDADVDEVARGAVQACFSNAGQLCLSAERIYVVESAYDAFLDAFVRETEALTLGIGYDYDAHLGSLVDGDQLARVESHVEDARERGATVETGGRARPDVAPYCYEPTVLTGVDPDATLACEETFGPVAAVTPVPDAEAAVAAANDSPYGLNASVWTGDRERGAALARDIDCGTVNVNDAFLATWGANDAPMGGFGDSGLGRRHGPEGIRRYTETRTVGVSRVGPLTFPERIPTDWFVRGAFGAMRVGQGVRRAAGALRRRLSRR
ncbi:succinate-semialdehyde dehydrogenase / glutarate-semialdehyde dehydrogenase [Halorubrum xinjiangense]|uniref:Succinate-semialdehyde dehydrogenase / glutarate-semialdehyde dehydrogenase n=1 Tax=Halorubrum xinjiangense TaxID=261291 RepID=A0A1G7LMS6_9EURY|nr:succinic semialdehyde dehydrogenase [Halorubrum xinjiangense]SDF50674.1 succinate-semialdehyde dehydrogenase / glutarate-semialdehyde dehydrogenase [Halorubrum xinjiangense]